MNEHEHDHTHHRGGRRGGPPITDSDRPGRGRRGARRPNDDHPRRGRMRRGDVRMALLIALLDEPGHGYDLIQALEAKSGGRWRPSPGSVYPSLQLLADEGLVVAADHDGKRVFELTEEGRRAAEERVASQGYPWDASHGEHGDLRLALRDLHLAAKQVVFTGSPEVVTAATTILSDARKALYRLLAEQ